MRALSNGPNSSRTGCGGYCTWERRLRNHVPGLPRDSAILTDHHFLVDALPMCRKDVLCTWEDFAGTEHQDVFA